MKCTKCKKEQKPKGISLIDAGNGIYLCNRCDKNWYVDEHGNICKRARCSDELEAFSKIILK